MISARTSLVAALTLSVIVTVVAWQFGARSVGGADSYGYVSQAHAWLSGDLLVRQPFFDANPPPFARWALAPLGWRPEVDGYGIVPIYSPGYPLLLAATKWLAGYTAMFAVVPLCAGLLVGIAYALGRRLGRPDVGLLAALLVATSPAVLFMSIAPMSDVPSAALWSAAFVATLGRRRRAAAAGGLIAGLAILVRPNLVSLAFLCVAWLLVRDVRSLGLRQMGRWRTPWFVAPAFVGAFINARINAQLFGSPWRSGYGDLSAFYAWSHLSPNVGRYAGFFSRAETPLVFVALILAVGAPWFLRRNPRARESAWLLSAATCVVAVTYLLYLVFDDWWYLRFMLPIWPLLAVMSASALLALWARHRVWGRGAAVLIVLLVVGYRVEFAVQQSVFSIGLTESRYPQVARTAAGVTDPTAVFITLQHSGSMRFYGGRPTVRWNFIEPDEFEGAVAWLAAHGHHPYLLLDRFEVDTLRAQYGPKSAIARLDWTPRMSFFNGETLLFDPGDRGKDFATTPFANYTNRTVMPVPLRSW